MDSQGLHAQSEGAGTGQAGTDQLQEEAMSLTWLHIHWREGVMLFCSEEDLQKQTPLGGRQSQICQNYYCFTKKPQPSYVSQDLFLSFIAAAG